MPRIEFKIFIQLIGIYLLLLMQTAAAQDNPARQQGLIGILYDDNRLTRIRSVWHLQEANSDDINWEDRNDFSAQWQGYLTAPAGGEFRFSAEANDEIQLRIDGKTIIDTWEGNSQLDGTLMFTSGQSYRVQLKYSQISGPSYMRLYWQPPNGIKQIIPAAAFYYKSADEIQVRKKLQSAFAIDAEKLAFDVNSIIEIKNTPDLQQKRQALIKVLWGNDGLPDRKMPAEINKNINDTDFVSLSNLQRIDKITIPMEYDITSIAYHFIAQQKKGQLAIYHQGHNGNFSVGIRTIQAFLENGYDVIALSMPLLGMNNRPIIELPRFGKILLHSHNQMPLLQPQQGHPVKYFIEPVVVALNHVLRFKYKRTIMIGISGGGWTTTLAAAIDPRIQISFPVAGTHPHFLRSQDPSRSGSIGDYEQSAPELYRTANYLELYLMGASGEGRKQLQILNEFDSCCFRGTGFKTYVEIVSQRVRELGPGQFDVFLDSTHRVHQISPEALKVIFSVLQNN